MKLSVERLSNETLLVLFKKLNEQGKNRGLNKTLTSIYTQVRDELWSRYTKEQFQQWEYQLYPKHMSYSGIDIDLVNEVLHVS